MNEFIAALDEAIMHTANSVTHNTRLAIAARLKAWLAYEAEKRMTDDLAAKIELQSRRFDELAQGLSVAMTDSQLVVKASGNAAPVLADLEYGTTWHEPMPSARERLLEWMLTSE